MPLSRVSATSSVASPTKTKSLRPWVTRKRNTRAALEQVRSLELGALRQLDAPTPDGTTLIELCIDPDEGPEARLERTELRAHLARALTALPDRERQILALYYEEELTMAEIGEVIGVCESRVSQLRSLALSRLRTSLRESLGQARVQ